MKKLFLSFLICLIFPQLSFAYNGPTTHAGLTEQIVEFYNLNNDIKLNSADKEALIKGSIEEDEPADRALNHFFDPVRGIGINNYRTSVAWASEINNGNEFSWPRSIEKYARGDREGALIGLGHILHLAEDLTVPEHTRNDPHMGDGPLGLGTGSSIYENWAMENKTRQSMKGTAVNYFRMGYKVRNSGDNIEQYFETIASYSNNNYVSNDTIENRVYQYAYPEVVEKRDGYAFGKDYFFYDRHKLYLDYFTKKGGFFKGLLDPDIKDFSVLEEYFTRLSKMAILSGAGIVETFLQEAERAREKYLAEEQKKQEELARLEAERNLKMTEGSLFSQLWYRLNYAVTDTTTAFAGAITDFGHTIYTGTSVAVNTLGNVANLANYTNTELATIGVQKVEQGVQTAKTAVISTSQKVILYVKENSQNFITPAVAYNPPTVSQSELDSLILALGPVTGSSDTNNFSDPDNSDNSESEEPVHHSSGGHQGDIIDPEPEIVETVEIIATTTEEVATTPEELATTTEEIVPTTITLEELVSSPTVLSAENIINTTPTTTIMFSGTSTPDFIISNDFDLISTTTDTDGNWSLSIENISEGTTTINFFAEPDILHASSTIYDIETKVTTIINYLKSEPTEVNIFVPAGPAVSISVPEPEQCQDSLLTDRCLITSDELEMSWSSNSSNLDYYTININDDPDDTTTTTDTSGTLDLYDETENIIEIFATDTEGNESDHIIYEVIVYRQPIYVEPFWSSDYMGAINSQINLYNRTPYDLNLENWSLSTQSGLFNVDLQGQIEGRGTFVLIKSADGVEITGADQIYEDTLTRDDERLYLNYFSDILSDTFLGIIAAW